MLEPKPWYRSRWLKLSGTSLLAVVFLVLAFRDVDWTELLAVVSKVYPLFLLLGCATLTASYFLRGIRWGLLLESHKATPSMMFWATAVGYLGNVLLPARAGDIIRGVVIARQTGLGASYVLATTISERIIDVIVLVTMSLLMITFLDGIADWILTAVRIMSLMSVAGLLILLATPKLGSPLETLVQWLPLPASRRQRVSSLIAHFLLGLRSFRRGDRTLLFFGMTGAVWLLDGLVIMEIAWAFGLRLSLPEAILLLMALGLSSTIPSTPGYIGVYQFVAVTVLTPLGFTQEQALGYILGFQLTTYATAALWGLLGLWRYNASLDIVQHSDADVIAVEPIPVKKA